MKFLITNIPARKRNNLERSRKWVMELREQLAAKRKQHQTLSKTLAEVLQRVIDLHPKAALDSEAALKLGAAELQLSKLQPEIDALEAELALNVAQIARKISAIRETDLRDSATEPLQEQLEAMALKVNAPWFAADELPAAAREWMGKTYQGRAIHGYLVYRRAPRLTNCEEADQALAATLAEIDLILSGEPPADFNPPNA